MSTTILASTPARADFLNTHQDYKGLPAVPIALNLRMHLTGKVLDEDVFIIKSLDLEKRKEASTDTFKIGRTDILEQGFFGNYFRGVLNVIAKQGLIRQVRGMEIEVNSEIPIGAGLGSSAALEVAFASMLNHACKLGYNSKDLAEVAFAAENQELGIPCGRLDQYGVSFGGIIKLDCRPPYNVESLPFKELTFAIADSGIRHSTSEIHPKRQAEINKGLKALMGSTTLTEELRARLGYRFDEPKWDGISESEISDLLSVLDDDVRRRILFTIRMNELTEFAVKVLRFKEPSVDETISTIGDKAWKRFQESPRTERDPWILGEVMNRQHALLRDLYDLSLPRIEAMCSAALEARAYGAKISGAGLGGCIIALVRDEEAGRKVVDACVSAGARNGWVSRIGEGARAESLKGRH